MSGSIHVKRPIVEKFISDPSFPYLISFERTGSHWLRMLMELYLEKPSLIRVFYYMDAEDFTCYHSHDLDLTIHRESVIYLYRHPVDTVYSNMIFHGDDCDNKEKIRYWTDYYARHLKKWLVDEDFVTRKTIISYEGLRLDIEKEFKKICEFFSVTFDPCKLNEVLARVTKEEVKRKTLHDLRVIDVSENYEIKRKAFHSAYWDEIMHGIFSVSADLEQFLINQAPLLRGSKGSLPLALGEPAGRPAGGR